MTVTGSHLDLRLADGRRVVVPLAFYPTLNRATPKERRGWKFLGPGTAVEWPRLDLQLSVESIIAGRREHLPPPGFRKWLNAEWDRMGLKRGSTMK